MTILAYPNDSEVKGAKERSWVRSWVMSRVMSGSSSEQFVEKRKDYSSLAQEQMVASDRLILVDSNDCPLGEVSKETAHRFPGLLHRAFSVLLFDTKGRLLIQKRAQTKVTFPGFWANTCCSHPYPSALEMEPKNHLGVKRAALRRLHQELGIPTNALSSAEMTVMARLHYRAPYDPQWVEEEVDYILLAVADVNPKPCPSEVEAIRWVSQQDLQILLDQEPDQANIAPWFRIIAQELLPSWWPHVCIAHCLAALTDLSIRRRS